VPRSINEAGDLYSRHVRLSTELWQTTKVREECIADESGVAFASDLVADLSLDDAAAPSVNGGKRARRPRRNTSMSVLSDGEDDEDEAEAAKGPDSLSMLQALEAEVAREAEATSDTARRKAREQRALDVQRLQRVEMLYVRAA
jgi:hypothetical protein